MNRNIATQDFDRAIVKGFWRKIISWLTGKDNQLLPFDEVREKMPIKGQHYIGLQQVAVEKIVGSWGRYRDFDRAFLPKQVKTKERWVSIDIAHQKMVILPPVELFKMGDVYFVKDGNHRVSVARERGQLYMDAYVTEIDISVPLKVDTTIEDLDLKKDYGAFLSETGLQQMRPKADLESKIPGQYDRLLEHIAGHRWYLGENRKSAVLYDEAVLSWYDQVYLPVIRVLRQQGVMKAFPSYSESDLYLWVMEYYAYLREAYQDEIASEEALDGEIEIIAEEEASRQFAEEYPELPVKKLLRVFKNADWLNEMILLKERSAFSVRTNLFQLRPKAKIASNLPGQYERLLNHIDVHRGYLREVMKHEVPYEEAVLSWYDNVYLPLVNIIRDEKILDNFPERTETDLYMWIITRQWYLIQASEKPSEGR